MGHYDAGLLAVPDVRKHKLGAKALSPLIEKTQECKANIGVQPEAAQAGESMPCVLPKPSLSFHSIDISSKSFLLICSDGIWEFISSSEAVELCSQFTPGEAM